MASRQPAAAALTPILTLTLLLLLLPGAAAFSAMLEIERKFLTPPDLLARVAAAGGRSLGEKVFTDTYFDNPRSYCLSTKDCWLRKRESAFELKVPLRPPGERTKSGGETEEFREVTALEDIARELRALGVDLDSAAGGGGDGGGGGGSGSRGISLGLVNEPALPPGRLPPLPPLTPRAKVDRIRGRGML